MSFRGHYGAFSPNRLCPNILIFLGWSSLIYALEGGHLDVYKYLVDHGALVDAEENNGGELLDQVHFPV